MKDFHFIMELIMYLAQILQNMETILLAMLQKYYSIKTTIWHYQINIKATT